MRNALVSEIRKITTTRMWWLLAIVMFAYLAFLGLVMAFSLSQDGGTGDLTGGLSTTRLDGLDVALSVYTLGASLGYVFPLVLGALSMTGEFRHETITPTLLLEPRRWAMLTAKLVANLGLGVVFGVVGTLGAVLGGAPLLAIMGDGTFLGNHQVLTNLALSVVALALWAVIGVGLGTMLTNQVAAVVVVLAFTQFVEPILRIGFSAVDSLAGVAKFFPGAAAEALVGSSLYSTTGMLDLLSRGEGAVVLLIYAGGFALVGRYTTLAHDIS